MNRGELVDVISKKTSLSKRKADAFLGDVMDAIKTGVKKEGEVRLVGFGTFKKASRKARKGRNPATGEAIKIPAKTFPKFVASREWNPAGVKTLKKASA